LSPCTGTQIDRNGNCYEPETVVFATVNGQSVPKISGCGCIKKTLAQRIQCPSGYIEFNNGCVTACPQGYNDIKDAQGNVSSLYCLAACPLKTNGTRSGSKGERWSLISNQCVKNYYKRVAHKNNTSVSLGSVTTRSTPVLGIPMTMASYLASKPMGSSINERIRSGQSIPQSVGKSLGSGLSSDPFENALGDSWLSLIFSPSKLLWALLLFGVVIFGGPYLFPLLAQGFGLLFKGLGAGAGSTAVGLGKVTEGTGSATGSLIAATGQVTADIEKAVGKNVAAAVTTTASKLEARNVARPIESERTAIEQLTTAQDALNFSRSVPQVNMT